MFSIVIRLLVIAKMKNYIYCKLKLFGNLHLMIAVIGITIFLSSEAMKPNILINFQKTNPQ